jgi:hypothetical protein
VASSTPDKTGGVVSSVVVVVVVGVSVVVVVVVGASVIVVSVEVSVDGTVVVSDDSVVPLHPITATENNNNSAK